MSRRQGRCINSFTGAESCINAGNVVYSCLINREVSEVIDEYSHRKNYGFSGG